jgi:hypothetical protein
MKIEQNGRNLMIREKTFLFRRGKIGDKPPSGYTPLDENDLPAFVLELDNKQVASACTMGEENHIFMISSFEWGKGYCTKLLEMWEKYAREKGYSKIIVSHVASDSLEHILEKKQKFSFEFDEFSEKTYYKNTLSPVC